MTSMTWVQWFLAVLIILVCGFLMLVILLQRGRGGGLAGAFGGGGGSSAFGAKTGDILTWVTVSVAAIFLVLAVVTNFAFDQTPRAPATTNTSFATPPESAPESEPSSGFLLESTAVPVDLGTSSEQDTSGSQSPGAEQPSDKADPGTSDKGNRPSP